MLAAIGVGSLEELFERQIPSAVRLREPLELPAGMPEQEVFEHLRALAERNRSVEQQNLRLERIAEQPGHPQRHVNARPVQHRQR